MQMVRDLTPLRRVFCSDDYDQAIDYLRQILPFNIVTAGASDSHNGWVVPPRWNLKEAKIYRDGRVIYDGLAHPLAVAALSNPFEGEVDLPELKRHLHYDRRFDDAIPYHFRFEYRPWERDWGFCVTKQFHDNLGPGNYRVVIRTEESPGELRMLEYTIPGRLPETFAFVAHLDHPGMSNDDLAGCAVGVQLFKELAAAPRKFTYKLLLLQEIIGSEFYLAHSRPPSPILEAIYLEMLGSRTPLNLQRSLSGQTELEYSVTNAAEELQIPLGIGDYRTVVCNDEAVWESYGIPMSSLSRFPYPEYHSSRDDLDIISESSLAESVDLLMASIDRLEQTNWVSKKFRGTVCLSNPRYDLYVEPGQGAFGSELSEERRRLRELMDLIPTLEKPAASRALARRTGLSLPAVETYLRAWAEKGLIDIR